MMTKQELDDELRALVESRGLNRDKLTVYAMQRPDGTGILIVGKITIDYHGEDWSACGTIDQIRQALSADYASPADLRKVCEEQKLLRD